MFEEYVDAGGKCCRGTMQRHISGHDRPLFFHKNPQPVIKNVLFYIGGMLVLEIVSEVWPSSSQPTSQRHVLRGLKVLSRLMQRMTAMELCLQESGDTGSREIMELLAALRPKGTEQRISEFDRFDSTA